MKRYWEQETYQLVERMSAWNIERGGPRSVEDCGRASLQNRTLELEQGLWSISRWYQWSDRGVSHQKKKNFERPPSIPAFRIPRRC